MLTAADLQHLRETLRFSLQQEDVITSLLTTKINSFNISFDCQTLLHSTVPSEMFLRYSKNTPNGTAVPSP